MGEYFNLWKVFGYVSLLCFFYNVFGFTVSGLLVATLVYFKDDLKDLKYAKKIIIRDVSIGLFFITKLIPNIIKTGNKSAFQTITETCQKFPNKKALIAAETGRYLTFKDIELFINKIGHVFKKAGYKPGDKVALFMGNELEYVPIWMGLNRIGLTVGLINCNLQSKSLEHSLRVVDYKGIISTSDLKPVLDDIGFCQQPETPVYILNSANDASDSTTKNLLSLIDKEDGKANLEEHQFKNDDTQLMIYTSGSTGRPKAAKVVNDKIKKGLGQVGIMFDIREDDICYNMLPMYHSNGGFLMIAPMLHIGCTTVSERNSVLPTSLLIVSNMTSHLQDT